MPNVTCNVCIYKGLFLLLIRSALLGDAWLGGFLPTNDIPGGTTRHGWKQFPSVLPRQPVEELAPRTPWRCSALHGCH